MGSKFGLIAETIASEEHLTSVPQESGSNDSMMLKTWPHYDQSRFASNTSRAAIVAVR